MSNVELNDDCFICKVIDDKPYIFCDNENLWYHVKCLGMSEADLERAKSVEEFKCNRCKAAEECSRSEEVDDQDYVVESIIGHSGEPPEREFCVQWEVDGSSTWLAEKECNSCIELIKIYCLEQGIAETTLTPEPGCGMTAEETPIKANWATIEQICEKINKYGKPKSLRAEVLKGQVLERDMLLVKQVASHCHVILYTHKNRVAYIADGGNTSQDCPLIAKILKYELPNTKIIHKEYRGQRETNQCASSAILIGIEFQKAHDKGEEPDNVMHPEKQTQKRLERVLHKQAGKRLQKWTPIHLQKKGVTCNKCGKNWPKAKNRNMLNLHKC